MEELLRKDLKTKEDVQELYNDITREISSDFYTLMLKQHAERFGKREGGLHRFTINRMIQGRIAGGNDDMMAELSKMLMSHYEPVYQRF